MKLQTLIITGVILDNVSYQDMKDCCESNIEAIDLEVKDLSTVDTVTVTWEII